MRLSVDLGPEAAQARRVSAVLSPDGTRLVYTGEGPNGLSQLYTRRLDQPGTTPLPGTDGLGIMPFFSPNGEWIGLVGRNNILKKVAAQGGAAITLGVMPDVIQGASWGDDDNIVYGSVAGLWRIPAAGGAPQQLTEGLRVFPQALPGGRAVLLNYISTDPAAAAQSLPNLESLDVGVVESETGETKSLIKNGYWPRYLPTSAETGHLVYMHDGTLFGVGFDPRSLQLLGTPVPLLDDVGASADPTFGGGQFAVSDSGAFVHLPGNAPGYRYPILSLDTAGKTTALVAQPGAYGAPRLSPDGKQLAYTSGNDVWVYNLAEGGPRQLTFVGNVVAELAWAPDSKHLVYGDRSALWWIRADGADQAQQLLDAGARPQSIAPAGDKRVQMLLAPNQVGGTPDLITLSIDLSDPERPQPGEAEPFLAAPDDVEVDGAFSPDGKFIAYSWLPSGAPRRPRSSCSRFRGRAANGRSRRSAARSPHGPLPHANCCMRRPTAGSWPPATRYRAIRSAPASRMCSRQHSSVEPVCGRISTCSPTANTR